MEGLSDQDKALLKWAVVFIYESGVHSVGAAANSVNFTNLVNRLTEPKQAPPAPKQEEKK